MNAWPWSQRTGRMERPAKATPPMPGVGARLTANEFGFSYEVPVRSGRYAHPWKPALNGARLTLSYGIVDGYPPKVGEVKLSPTGVQPAIALDAGVANAAGESWICLEVMPEEDGMLIETSERRLVHTKETRSLDPKLGRCPLVQILWRGGQPFRAFEIAYYNLRYGRVMPPTGGGAVRHVFY
jgi:hypothetical protein